MKVYSLNLESFFNSDQNFLKGNFPTSNFRLLNLSNWTFQLHVMPLKKSILAVATYS